MQILARKITFSRQESDITNHITLGKKIDNDSAPRSNKKGNVETRSDGGVVIYRQGGGHTGSSRIGRIPIISFEVSDTPGLSNMKRS